MIGAIVRNNMVVNTIVISEENIPAMENALSCEIADAAPYGLVIGDLRTQRGWTRNAGGEQIVLPLLEQAQYDSYTLAMQRVAEMETAQEQIAAEAASEAMAILSGEEDET